MADPITITSQTLLKLLIRRGTDTDRQQVTLTEGELGYTIDTERLFVGNGSTKGGRPVGIKFLGQNSDITNLRGLPDDIGYENDVGLLRVITENDGSSLSDWLTIGGPGSTLVDDQTIEKSANGTISVKQISAAQIDDNTWGLGLEESGTTVQVKAVLTLNEIQARSSTFTLPQTMRVGSRTYVFPSNPPAAGDALISDSAGNLRWEAPKQGSDTLFVTQEQVPVGSVIAYLSGTSIPQGWFLTDGSALTSTQYPDLYAAIGTTYGSGDGSTTNFNLPNFTGDTLYGVTSIPGTILPNLSAAGVASLSAEPVVWIIKWRPDTINVAKVNLTNGLSAIDGNGSTTTVINLSSEYTLGINEGNVGAGNEEVVRAYNRAQFHGIRTYALATQDTDVDGSETFTVPEHVYQFKVIATGGGGIGFQGADAFGFTGGAGGTIIAYVSCAPGQTFGVKIGGAGSISNGGYGGGSALSYNSVDLLSAIGAQRQDGGDVRVFDYTTITSFVSTWGGDGGVDTNSSANREEGQGAGSWWGTSPAYGGGSSAEESGVEGFGPAAGIVMIEY